MLPTDGFLILDKPVGISSAKAVAEIKRLLKCKKIGHGGTLDPLASGVLPLAIGEATKAFDYIASATKGYRFTVTFGQERSTDDAEGEVTEQTDALPTVESLLKILPEFTGRILQIPPAYSALKVNGERAYKLARAGNMPEMKAREVDIFSLTLIDHQASSDGRVGEATLEVTCGKGTYVRALARDIARKINSMGYVSALRRTRVGKFEESQAISLEKCAEFVHSGALLNAWITLELALDDIPAIEVNAQEALKLRQGQPLPANQEDGGYLIKHQQKVLAIGKVAEGRLRAVRVFNV